MEESGRVVDVRSDTSITVIFMYEFVFFEFSDSLLL